MFEDIAHFEGRMAKVSGCARGGKTEALIRRCVALVAAGTEPEQILFEVTSAQAAQNVRIRLEEALDDKSAAWSICIATALEICRGILETPQAKAVTGRNPRLLNRAEFNFVLEDLRVLALSPRRLRKMLRFFYAKWANAERESNWLRQTEERPVVDHLRRDLKAMDAMIPEEVAYLCANYLLSDDGKEARHAYSHVLCDDFQNMSKAEQTCMCVLAKDQLIVAGNPNEVAPANIRDPNPQGFVEFESNRKDCETFELATAHGNPSIIRFSDALLDASEMDPTFKALRLEGANRAVESIKWNTPEEELNGFTKELRVYIDEHDDVLESDVTVLVPNMRWAKLARNILHKRGFKTSLAGVGMRLGGDPRQSDHAKPLAAYIKLGLLAHPHDMVSWRCWIGLDNHLTNSDIWENLLEYAEKNDLGLYEALEEVSKMSTEPFLRASELAEKWRTGQEFINKNTGRRGFNLMRAIGAEGIVAFDDISRSLSGDESAGELFALVTRQVFDTVYPPDPHTLRIATYDHAAGIEAKAIYAIAAVDGMIPSRNAFEVVSTEEARALVMNTERKLFHTAVCKAKERLVVSYFCRADLETAERAKMQVTRVRSDHGERIALLRPCSYLAEAGASCPASSSGQALLAELGLA